MKISRNEIPVISIMSLFILFFCFVVQTSFARKFYFSASIGNDAYTNEQAQDPNTPWSSLRKLQNFGNSGLALAGDTFAFRSGDVFMNGRDEFGSLKWWAINGFKCPSGTPKNPIVFTSYGTGEKPNFLFPSPCVTTGKNRVVMAFDGVSYIIIDGLQFSDYRFPVNDKVSTAFTAMGILLGEEGLSSKTHNSIIRNCHFNNIGFGVSMCGDYNQIDNNTFSNFKNTGDTSGTNDIGAVPLILMSGKYNRVTNNIIRGGWAFTGEKASGAGLNGVGIELMNDFDSSFIGYNIVVDCAGGMEIGNNRGISTVGPNDDTIAYNQFINNGVLCYASTSGSFVAKTSKIRVWNNVYVENGNSRFSGPKHGQDVFGDGQSFASFPSWPSFPRNPSVFNYGGFRILQYPLDSGNTLDTLFDSRNNVFWMTNQNQAIYSNTYVRYKHLNNLYHLVGQSALGGTLNTGSFLETRTTSSIFVDTLPSNPLLWNLFITPSSVAYNFGRSVRLLRDFTNKPIVGNPDAGIHENQSSAPVIRASFSPIICNGDSTTVNISANGGVPPYTGTGNFRRVAGVYVFTIRDAMGTQVNTTVNLTQPLAMIANTYFNRIIEFDSTTTINVSVMNGRSPYRYQLNGGVLQNTGVFNSVRAGLYNIQVIDSNACKVSTTIDIKQPSAPFVIQTSIDSIRCYGGQATIRVGASGGTPPYVGVGTFLRFAGRQTFIVNDSNGVSRTVEIILSQPDSITLNYTYPRIQNFGGNTQVSIIANGGKSPYSYSWNGATYQSSSVFNNIIPGNYTISLKDTNACILSKLITIEPPVLPVLNVNSSFLPIICKGGSTSIIISATGGIPPYTGTGSFPRNAGTYNFTVTDSAGQTKSVTIIVTEPNLLAATVSSGSIAVFGGTTSITVSGVSGGRAPYTYRLNNGAFQTGNIFSTVNAGTYSINIKDSLGCTLTKTLSIFQPVKIDIRSFTNNTCRWLWNGTITCGALGGKPPYFYKINSFAYGSSNIFTSLGPGTYTVSVKDSLGSVSSTSVTILASNVICAKNARESIHDNSAPLILFPNPSNHSFSIKPTLKNNIDEIEAYDIRGKRIMRSSFSQEKSYGAQWQPGVYLIRGKSMSGFISAFEKWVKMP